MGNSFSMYHRSLTVSAAPGAVGYVAGACDPEMKYRANVKARLVLAFEEIAEATKNPTYMGLALAEHRKGLIIAARNGALLNDADAKFAGLLVVEDEVVVVEVVEPVVACVTGTTDGTVPGRREEPSSPTEGVFLHDSSFAAFIGQ